MRGALNKSLSINRSATNASVGCYQQRMRPSLIYGDDGSLLIEWTGEGERFGIILEQDLEKSGWYIVNDNMDQGELPMRVLMEMVNFILLHSGGNVC